MLAYIGIVLLAAVGLREVAARCKRWPFRFPRYRG